MSTSTKRDFICLMVSGLFLSNRSMACSFKPSSLSTLLAGAEVVFIGSVQRGMNARNNTQADGAATFLVQRVIKGDVRLGDNVSISAATTSSCGSEFMPGETWLIMADARRATWLGAGNILISNSEGELDARNAAELEQSLQIKFP